MNKKLSLWFSNVLWILCIVLSGFFAGKLGDFYIEKRFSAPKKVIIAKPKRQKRKKSTSLLEYESQIIKALTPEKKSSTTKPKTPSKVNDSPSPSKPEIPWNEVIETGIDRILVKGTVIGEDTAIAFLNINGTDVAVSIGEKVGSYEVWAISKNSVTFSKGNIKKVAYMGMGEKSKRRRYTGSVTPRVIGSSKRNNLENIVTYRGGVRIIDRRKFNALLKPPSPLAHEIKFIPNSKDGKPYGIKISYLKPGSFFSKIGLRSGDVFIRINKKDLKTVDDSYYAYQAFKNEDHLTLVIDRNGRKITIPLEFR